VSKVSRLPEGTPRRKNPEERGTGREINGSSNPSPPARVLIAEDHALFAEVMVPALRKLGMEVLEPVEDGASALEVLAHESPDIVLVDLGLPDMDGTELGRRILAEHPNTKVLAVTAFRDPNRVQRALKAGFHGYLDKETTLHRFGEAIRAALAGNVVVQRTSDRSLAQNHSDEERFVEMLRSRITPREHQVLGLLVDGAGTREMARRMGVSTNTVRTHVQNILEKFQVNSRLEAVAFAVRHRLVPQGEGLATGNHAV
jgi:DNA-binding NarL/FixJ family response regulator